jgi:hypothetical protein
VFPLFSESTTRRRPVVYVVLLLALAACSRQEPPEGAFRASPPPPPTTTTAPAPATTAAPPTGTCEDALAWAASVGLPLPRGTGYRCPSTMFAHHGASCWYAAPCPNSKFIAINTELMGAVSQQYFRYVVAHEICHMMHFDAGRSSTEPEADACAADYGATPG